ncbi:MAG: glycosyltransferase, partial [Mariprofundaceae bacterium]
MGRNCVNLFAEAEWFSPELKREWVRYRNDENPSGVCWFVPVEQGKPLLSVIIPTADADRGGYFAKLMESLTLQDMQDFELIVIKGDKRQGRGINIAIAKAQG